MAKLCARGKAAAKRKFKVYPSAYANMYASAVCSGKITPGGKKKKKKAKKRRNYPKCVPAAKARSMSPSQRRAAVSRKKKAERRPRKGKRPNYART